jgi:hypothetical protein
MSAGPDWASLDAAFAKMASFATLKFTEPANGSLNSALSLGNPPRRKKPPTTCAVRRAPFARRVLDVKEQSPGRIVLEVQRFGRAKPSRFEFLRPDSPRTPAKVSREQFKVTLRREFTRSRRICLRRAMKSHFGLLRMGCRPSSRFAASSLRVFHTMVFSSGGTTNARSFMQETMLSSTASSFRSTCSVIGWRKTRSPSL